MRFTRAHVWTSMLLLSTLPAGLLAQQKPLSPRDQVNATIDGAKMSIDYGRPYVKGRKIWGGLNPWNQVWRLGANEATGFTTDKALQMGNVTIPAGKYTLYMWVDEQQPKLIVNKQTGQWGTEYSEAQDLARIDLKKETVAQPVEQLTLALDQKAGGGLLKITWDTAQYSVPFTVTK